LRPEKVALPEPENRAYFSVYVLAPAVAGSISQPPTVDTPVVDPGEDFITPDDPANWRRTVCVDGRSVAS
jgi:hypothetical protein